MNKNNKHINNILLRVSFLIICMSQLFVSQILAQFTINENFKGSSIESNIFLGGNPSATLTSGVNDPINNGWLRLTTDDTNQRGYVYIDNSFPSTLGVYVDFEYKTWRSKKDVSYSGADGISVFLFNAAISPFQIGAFGGSLGYANQESTPGLAGGYLGIGLDEYGNFARESEGKPGGTADLAPNSIVLRGTADHANPYRYLAHKQLQTSASSNTNSIDFNTQTTTRPTDALFYRRVKIYIEPIGAQTTPKYRIRVLWRTTPNGTDTEHINYETTDPIPSFLKLGFGASTGGGFNFHEIRNLYITTPGNVRVQKRVDKENAIPNEELTYTVDVSNDTPALLNNLLLTDVIKLENGNIATSDDFQITSIIFNNNGYSGNTASGFTSGIAKTTDLSNSLSTTLSMAANSESSFTIKGTIKKVPQGGVITNTVSIDPTRSGITDKDLSNNNATVSSTVLNPNIDLKIEKGVDNNGIAKQIGNKFTIVVSNSSTLIKPTGQEVTVTDIIPAGLTVTGYTANGWTRTISGNTHTFKRSDALNSGYAYPPIIINVTPSGAGPWTNTVKVLYSTDNNLANNESSAQLRWLNFWHGTIDNDWNKTGNWTSNFVPASGENIEFATEQNNPTISGVNYSGPAKNDLNLDKDRVIGDLINSSDKNLIITTGNQLTINGKVTDTNFNMGTIVVKASQDKPSGTLIFTNPGQNQNVGAIVEFYNQAYDCADCGFYTRSWQYFGIPVVSADFPYNDVTGTETINQWVEPFDGNKWQNAPYTPDTKLEAFKGYEITNNIKTQPTSNYRFSGIVKTSDAMVGLTKSTNVNYSGANLVGNSYTAAIPINADALIFPTGAELTVYLFNTGTRDQWRKLNGGSVSGVGYGQYLSVPINLGGTENLPSIIPSMHSFMVLTNNSGDLQIKYDKLVKNTTVNKGDGTQIVTRSTNNSENVESSIISNSKDQLPSIVIDVIGQQSADRVWIFTKGGTTNGFDNGWDGRKIIENGINQIYVVGDSKDDHFQVATVSALNNLQLDFAAGNSGTFTLEFSLSKHWDLEELYLHDLLTDKKHRVINGSSYRFEAKKDESPSRFRLLYSGNGIPTNDESAKITTDATTDGKIVINNNSNLDCTIFISNTNGKLVQKLEVKANSKESLENIAKETYVIRLQNALVSDVRKLVVK
ncbi:MAG: hypothetical protein WCS06_07705 [Dysgonamonadaceae bacterium]